MDQVLIKYFDDLKVLRCVTDVGANMTKIYKPALKVDEILSPNDKLYSGKGVNGSNAMDDSDEFEEESAEETIFKV